MIDGLFLWKSRQLFWKKKEAYVTEQVTTFIVNVRIKHTFGNQNSILTFRGRSIDYDCSYK